MAAAASSTRLWENEKPRIDGATYPGLMPPSPATAINSCSPTGVMHLGEAACHAWCGPSWQSLKTSFSVIPAAAAWGVTGLRRRLPRANRCNDYLSSPLPSPSSSTSLAKADSKLDPPPYPTRKPDPDPVGAAEESLARIMHEPPAATADLAVLPGVLGCSFDRLRTSSPCDVRKKYASGPSPCGDPVARPSPRSRDGVSRIMRVRKAS